MKRHPVANPSPLSGLAIFKCENAQEAMNYL